MESDLSDIPHGHENVSNMSANFTWYVVVACVCACVTIILALVGKLLDIGQKTRSPQQRRAFAGPRTRTSLSQSEPTIYVSPANLPPPPKYEAMAPPSYEEVVGIHYPQYQIPPVQPITHPITTALAQSSNSTDGTTPVSSRSENVPSTVITVTTEETRSSPTVTTT